MALWGYEVPTTLAQARSLRSLPPWAEKKLLAAMPNHVAPPPSKRGRPGRSAGGA